MTAGKLTLPGVILVAWCLAATCAFTPASAQNPDTDYLIELGTVHAVVGQTSLLVPIIITNPQPLIQWQLGLEYDEVFLAFKGVRFGDTASEGLNPLIDIVAASFATIRVVYAESPLPAGIRQIVAYLEFNVLDPGILMSGEKVTSPLIVVGGEVNVTEFILIGGQPVVPVAIPGGVTIHGGNLLEIGESVGNNYGVIEVPIKLWNQTPVNMFSLGLEYDEVFLLRAHLDGSVFAAASPDAKVDILPEGPGQARITVSAGTSSIPVGGDQLVTTLILETTTPVKGLFALIPIPAETSTDGLLIPNLLQGSVTVEAHFIRGDLNFDDQIVVADATQLLLYIFSPGAQILCEAAADVDDNSVISLTDPLYLLAHLFTNGPLPPPPFPDPGPDPTPPARPCL